MTQKSATGKAAAAKASGQKPAVPKSKAPGAGAKGRPAPKPTSQPTDKATIHNREVQLNGTSDKYWKARGLDGRPQNWETLLKDAPDKKS
jgi:hypothetical protein